MNFKFLGIMIVSTLLATSTYSYNAHRLEFEAETYVARISSNIPAEDDIVDEEEMIRGSLSFLGDDEIFEEKYTQSGSFQSLYEKSIQETPNHAFKNFSRACLNLYRDFETNSNKRKQVSVHMLFEKVKEKLELQLRSYDRFEQLKRKYTPSSDASKNSRAEADKMLNFFMNVDKGASVLTS